MPDTILLDGSPMGGGVSGAGRYAYQLLDNLIEIVQKYDLQIVVPPVHKCHWEIKGWKDYKNVELIETDITGAGFLRQRFYLTRKFDYDIFHSLSSYLPIGIFGTSVVTIHDLKHIVNNWGGGEYSSIKRAYVRALVWNSVRQADRIITVSEHTKSDVVKNFNITSDRIDAIHLGPGKISEVTTEPPVDTPYFLFVGELRPHKNLSSLIRAYNKFRTQTDSYVRLVIVGRQYGDTDPLAMLDSHYEDDVQHLGNVDEDTLSALYQNALALVYPSLYEGFGLPVLEAMGYGTPVVVSNRTSLPEVAGEAGLYFDPENIHDITNQLQTVADSRSTREKLQQASRNRFNDFSWERTARQTLSVYEKLI